MKFRCYGAVGQDTFSGPREICSKEFYSDVQESVFAPVCPRCGSSNTHVV